MALATLAVTTNAARAGLWPIAPDGDMLVRDFATIWAAAVRAISGEAMLVYDHALHDQFYAHLLGQPPEDTLAFGYPPSALIVFWPLGAMPYGTAMAAFLMAGFIAWVSVLRSICGDWTTSVLMALACGGATQTIMQGQTGFFEAALLAGGLLTLPRRPLAAGAMFGLLALKPHLVLAVGLFLLLRRQWRAIGAAIGTSALLALIATIAFGWQIWPAYLQASADLSSSIAERSEAVVRLMMQSPLALAHGSASLPAAMMIHLAVALAALAGLIFVTLRSREHLTCCAAVIAASLLVTPYSFLYNATVLVAAAAMLTATKRRADETIIALVAIALPALWYVTLAPFVPASAVLLLGLCVVLTVRADRGTPRSGEPAKP